MAAAAIIGSRKKTWNEQSLADRQLVRHVESETQSSVRPEQAEKKWRKKMSRIDIDIEEKLSVFKGTDYTIFNFPFK